MGRSGLTVMPARGHDGRMTSTSTARPTGSGSLPGLLDAAVPTEPDDVRGSGPRRRRSRFPGPGAPGAAGTGGEHASVLWAGADGSLREQVRDHATAAGLELTEASSGTSTVGVVVAADALRSTPVPTGALAPRGADGRTDELGGMSPAGVPLLVVTGGREIPSELWRLALAAGARAVIPLPSGSEELLSHLADLARPRTSSLVLGVVGGCGGAGASSFAARLAGAARAHGPVALIDADPWGGGVDLLVEAAPRNEGTRAEGIGWTEVARLGPDDGEALRDGLPTVDGVHLLAAGDGDPPAPAAVDAALSALAPLGSTVVVDLSPSLVPVASEHLDLLLVVVPARDHAVRAAARRLREWAVPAGLAEVVVRGNGPLTAREVGEDLALPPAASFRDSPRGLVPLLDVRRGGADGAARTLLTELAGGAR